MTRIALLLLLLAASAPSGADSCADRGTALQILGSGGSPFHTHRAGSAYLVWINGKSRVLINAGSGSALRFLESGAKVRDLDVIALSRLHVDHSAGLPGLINAAAQGQRARALPVFGPEGSKTMPSTVAFVRTLFDERRGAWRELGSVLSPLGARGFKLQPHDIRTRIKNGKPELDKAQKANPVLRTPEFSLSTAAANYGESSVLAWRVQLPGRTIVFTGDSHSDQLAAFAHSADVLVAHLSAAPVTRGRHDMTPRAIAQLANTAGVKHLVLAHRTMATAQLEQEAVNELSAIFKGKISLADDLACYALE